MEDRDQRYLETAMQTPLSKLRQYPCGGSRSLKSRPIKKSGAYRKGTKFDRYREKVTKGNLLSYTVTRHDVIDIWPVIGGTHGNALRCSKLHFRDTSTFSKTAITPECVEGF